MFNKTPGKSVDKILNQTATQIAQLDAGIAELHLETIGIEAQIDELLQKQDALDEKIEKAMKLRNAIAEQVGIEPIDVEFLFKVQEGE